jgi:hypothetical protein
MLSILRDFLAVCFISSRIGASLVLVRMVVLDLMLVVDIDRLIWSILGTDMEVDALTDANGLILLCTGSVACVGGACTGGLYTCGVSTGGKACIGSVCIGSVCIGSVCIGSVCIDSVFTGGVYTCGVCTGGKLCVGAVCTGGVYRGGVYTGAVCTGGVYTGVIGAVFVIVCVTSSSN